MKNNIVNKNEKYVVDIIDYGIDGEGIAKIDGFTIFVQNAMRGEKCEILILKVLKTHAFAKILNIIEKSQLNQNIGWNLVAKLIKLVVVVV